MKKISFLLLTFYFTTNSVHAYCNCGSTTDARWSGIEVKKNRIGPVQKIKCDYQFSLNCKDTLWSLSRRFTCFGSCTASYKVNISRGSTLIRTIDPFSFTTGYFTFSETGNYKTEIRPYCGGTSCKSCFFYFTASGTGCRSL